VSAPAPAPDPAPALVPTPSLSADPGLRRAAAGAAAGSDAAIARQTAAAAAEGIRDQRAPAGGVALPGMAPRPKLVGSAGGPARTTHCADFRAASRAVLPAGAAAQGVAAACTLEDVFAAFDVDGDGRLAGQEFRWFLGSFKDLAWHQVRRGPSAPGSRRCSRGAHAVLTRCSRGAHAVLTRYCGTQRRSAALGDAPEPA
jgi:hypothetical protein